ncbi:MAG: hypothetical protein GWP10_21940 [Nitrospiraceae bacterium]|nr:hypothetical protein [Nitrospiraceae bacterium]
MSRKTLLNIPYFFFAVLLLVAVQACTAKSQNSISLSCKEDNDLYLTLKENKIACARYNTPEEAINNAGDGSGVLILADGYPEKTTEIAASLYEKAHSKKLRLYVEYPSYLPGLTMAPPRTTLLERVVVSTDAIENLTKMQILALHDCNYIPISVENPLLVVSKVAGFDHAIYGLDKDANTGAILFEQPAKRLLVSTTKLSQFVSARYAPKEAMQAIWAYILDWLEGDKAPTRLLDWTPTVRPSYTREQKLPTNAARLAIQRGVDWYTEAKMLLNEQGWEEYKQLWKLNDSNMLTTVVPVNNIAPQPKAQVGDGSFGVLEGIPSRVHLNGSQPTRWWLRSDCNGESSLAFALRWKMDDDYRSKLIAGNLLDWVYFRSGLFQKDSSKANYGLLFWAPGNVNYLFHDNDIKAILGCIGTSGILNTDRWDEVLVKNILGNFRTTGVNGFRCCLLFNHDLLRDGWQSYWNRDTILLQPHYEAWIWSSYLWLYDKTQWKPLLEKTRKGISMMMKAYPKDWKWTNGIQQERGRMLLPLAWLIRVDDRPEYRAWLKQIANDIEKCQDKSGAIREELGALDHAADNLGPPRSNAEYGRIGDTPLIQENGDCVSDLLYTCNFTFLGLHEAYAATGDEQYKRMADRLADFLIRIQIRSEKHSELDGGWFRAFDYRRWEYFGSNTDVGWGAWCIETGWTQGWIPTVLAMRELNINLWDITQNSKVEKHFERIRRQMIPDEINLNKGFIPGNYRANFNKFKKEEN